MGTIRWRIWTDVFYILKYKIIITNFAISEREERCIKTNTTNARDYLRDKNSQQLIEGKKKRYPSIQFPCHPNDPMLQDIVLISETTSLWSFKVS